MIEAGGQKDTFDWMRKQLGGTKSVDPLDTKVEEAFEQLKFERTEREAYVADVCETKKGDWIYHIFLRSNPKKDIRDKIEAALLETFKIPEKLALSHVQLWVCTACHAKMNAQEAKEHDGYCMVCKSRTELRMDSWAIKVSGFGANPLAQPLKSNFFTVLDRHLAS